MSELNNTHKVVNFMKKNLPKNMSEIDQDLPQIDVKDKKRKRGKKRSAIS